MTPLDISGCKTAEDFVKFSSTYEDCTERKKKIRDLLPEGGRYREVGFHQALMIAYVLEKKPRFVEGWDVTFKHMNQGEEKLLNQYAKDNNIEFSLNKIGSNMFPWTEEVDVQFIDALKQPDYVYNCLTYSAPLVKSHIIVDDTNFEKLGKRTKDMHEACLKFCEDNPEWELQEYFLEHPGITILRRV